jgi:glycosyltransferase involved in cell wall biosynthesis
MNLAIVYHLHKNFLNLSKSIDSLFSQDNMDFELILVNDFYIDEVKDILKKYDFSKFKNVKFLNFNANLGHAISFNKSLQLTKSKFIFYMGSNVVLQNNFVSIICSTIKQSDGADIISFLNKKDDSKEKLLSFSSLTEQEYKLVKYGIKDKIFNTNFLKSKKIILNEQKYMPLLFLYEIISSFTK